MGRSMCFVNLGSSLKVGKNNSKIEIWLKKNMKNDQTFLANFSESKDKLTFLCIWF